MGEVYISDLLSHTLPEWVPHFIWYTMDDMGAPQGSRHIFELTRTDAGQHIRHTQEYPKYEDAIEFTYPDAVNATVVAIRDNNRTIMMLKGEETEYNS